MLLFGYMYLSIPQEYSKHTIDFLVPVSLVLMAQGRRPMCYEDYIDWYTQGCSRYLRFLIATNPPKKRKNMEWVGIATFNFFLVAAQCSLLSDTKTKYMQLSKNNHDRS